MSRREFWSAGIGIYPCIYILRNGVEIDGGFQVRFRIVLPRAHSLCHLNRLVSDRCWTETFVNNAPLRAGFIVRTFNRCVRLFFTTNIASFVNIVGVIAKGPTVWC